MTAVLFDMDGVIVDSEDYWVELERERLLPRVVPDDDVAVAEITGMNYRDIYDYLDSTYDTAVSREEFVDLFDAAARELYSEKVSLFEGFHDLLAALERRDVPVALVSSSPHDWIGIVLERFDLEGEFDEVISAEEIDGDGKPEPDVFEYAAGEVGVSPENCVAVEDSSHGIESAARAGTTVVAYRIDAHDGVDHSPAHEVVDSPAELRETVLALVE
ncbi:HAD family hydrolase [Natrononativus amylolyticus]|uniref:HAD family hydrolase n=1 Tax=Natrononativus amylolyticus TaxID=2963434 RepID=UPI0020CEA920|nr:HAD family phosphatase [Natrononativus amylolyticus]